MDRALATHTLTLPAAPAASPRWCGKQMHALMPGNQAVPNKHRKDYSGSLQREQG